MPSDHTLHTVRTALGIIGDFTSFALFASPMPTMKKILKKKSVEEFHPFPYLAGAINCAFWVLYAMPFNHPDSVLVLIINSIGLVLEFGYIVIFFLYAKNKMRLIMIGVFLLELLFFIGMVVIDVTLFHTHKSRTIFIGFFSVVFGIILYASPLSVMYKVVKTKNAESMPFLICLAGFLNGGIWAAYAVMGKFDPFIFTGNGIGAILGSAQLILWLIYMPYMAKRAEKTPEVELP